jgi:RNA polymerase sigma-70 factor (ECF subfamily)
LKNSLRIVKSSNPALPADAELVGLIRAGDAGAGEVLFRRHYSMVAGLAFRLLAGDSEVDDVVQDAFSDALRSLYRLENPQAFASWIASIVVQNVSKRLRRRRLLERFGLRQHRPLDVDSFISPDCPPEVALELNIAYRVLAELSAATQMAFVLRRVEGFTIEETALHMHLSTATVKRRLAEAEAHLLQRRTDES